MADGVRLMNIQSNSKLYVGGMINPDNARSTFLAILIPKMTMKTDVTYGCWISFVKKTGLPDTIKRKLFVSSEGWFVLSLSTVVDRVELVNGHYFHRFAIVLRPY